MSFYWLVCPKKIFWYFLGFLLQKTNLKIKMTSPLCPLGKVPTNIWDVSWHCRSVGPEPGVQKETRYNRTFFFYWTKWQIMKNEKNWELHINSFFSACIFSSRVIKDCMAMKRVGFVQNNCLTRSLHAEGVHIIKRYGKPMATECTTQAPVIKNDSMLPDVIMRAKRFDWHAS